VRCPTAVTALQSSLRNRRLLIDNAYDCSYGTKRNVSARSFS
jgi:hypothetical protein